MKSDTVGLNQYFYICIEASLRYLEILTKAQYCAGKICTAGQCHVTYKLTNFLFIEFDQKITVFSTLQALENEGSFKQDSKSVKSNDEYEKIAR